MISRRITASSLELAARTTVAATVSLLIAELFQFREAYWAPITTLVVTQSTLGAALEVSGQRFFGTVLGAGAGALLASWVGNGVPVFAGGVFALGIICTILGLGRAAYRFAGITLAVVILVPRSQPAWVASLHRFFEVSLGIAVGLAMTALWPERTSPVAANVSTTNPGGTTR